MKKSKETRLHQTDFTIQPRMTQMITNEEKILYKNLSYKIIGLAMEVHSKLGYEFLEKVYENAMMVKKTLNMKDLFNRKIIIYSCRFVFIRG